MSAMSSKPMDEFSAYLDIPFDVAAYCRGRRLCVETVALQKAIRERIAADNALAQAQAAADAAAEKVRTAVSALRRKIDNG